MRGAPLPQQLLQTHSIAIKTPYTIDESESRHQRYKGSLLAS